MKKILAFLAFLLAPCAAIAAPTLTANSANTHAGTNPVAITTTSDCAPGDYSIWVGNAGAAATSFSATDSAGNTYSAPSADPGVYHTTFRYGLLYSKVSTDLPIGGTVTITYNGSGALTTNSLLVCAHNLASSSVLDVQGGTTGGNGKNGTSGTALSGVATGTLAQASELLICTAHMNAFLSGYMTDTGNGWGHIGSAPSGSFELGVDYQVVSSTNSVTCNAAWTPAGDWGGGIYSFKGASDGGSSSLAGLLTTIGVGQ